MTVFLACGGPSVHRTSGLLLTVLAIGTGQAVAGTAGGLDPTDSI